MAVDINTLRYAPLKNKGDRDSISKRRWNDLIDYIKSLGSGSSSSSSIIDDDGDTSVTVDTDPSTDTDTITLTAEGNVLGYLNNAALYFGDFTGGNSYFYIDPGNNRIQFASGSTDDLKFRPAGLPLAESQTEAQGSPNLGLDGELYRMSDGTVKYLATNTVDYSYRNLQTFVLPITDETTVFANGTNTYSIKLPYDFEVIEVQFTLNTASDADITCNVSGGGSNLIGGFGGSVSSGNTFVSFTSLDTTTLSKEDTLTGTFTISGATTGTGFKVNVIGYDI